MMAGPVTRVDMGKAFYNGKVVIITGASSGIGREMALQLARQGAWLVLAARSTLALERLEQDIHQTGGQAISITTDVSQIDQVNRLVNQALSTWGKVDILIANAGQYIRSPVSGLTPQIFEQSMAVNFYGAVNTILAVLPHMWTRKCGHILLVSTMDARSPVIGDSPYVAAKYALSGFGDVLRQELHGTGIHVTTVFPGRIDTPMIAWLHVPWISAKIPAQKAAVAILASLERRQAEVIFPPQAHILNWLHFISPSVADWAVRFFHLNGWEDRKS
jgi:dehydrogenase/reductase SDR family protein 7B